MSDQNANDGIDVGNFSFLPSIEISYEGENDFEYAKYIYNNEDAK